MLNVILNTLYLLIVRLQNKKKKTNCSCHLLLLLSCCGSTPSNRQPKANNKKPKIGKEKSAPERSEKKRSILSRPVFHISQCRLQASLIKMSFFQFYPDFAVHSCRSKATQLRHSLEKNMSNYFCLSWLFFISSHCFCYFELF